MACLLFVPIRSHPGATLDYITRRDAILLDQSYDVYRALNYMGEPDSTRRVLVYSNHCSQHPKLAEQEMKLHQHMYYQSKKGVKQVKGELWPFILSLAIQRRITPMFELWIT